MGSTYFPSIFGQSAWLLLIVMFLKDIDNINEYKRISVVSRIIQSRWKTILVYVIHSALIKHLNNTFWTRSYNENSP